MRRITVVGMIILGLVAMPLVAAARNDPKPDKKVEICHVTGNGEAQLIEVNKNAFEAHEAHGDWEVDAEDSAEACVAPSGTTEIPELTAAFATSNETCLAIFNCTVDVDASESLGDIVKYIWSAPGASGIVGSEGMITTITGMAPGTHDVRLDIKDVNGDTTFIEMSVSLTYTP